MSAEVNSAIKSSEEAKERKGPKGCPVITAERCKGCGFCVEFCPSNVLRMSRSFNSKGYHHPEIVDAEACTGCDLCGMYCPDFAIYGIRTGGKKRMKDEG